MKIKKSCVVTGGAGFIGSHLCTALIEKGYEVICLDNLITGSETNLESLKKSPFFHFIKSDVINFSRDLLNNSRVDFVYHLASPASPPQYMRYSIETLLVNSIGTYNMLEFCRKKKSIFLLTSTSEVYGDPKEHPQKESYYGHVNPVGIRACYDESKRFAEAITMEYTRKYNSDIRIIRIFNTFGPNMQKDDGRVISNFIMQAITGNPLTIYGKGAQTRSFCYVSDMVDGLISAMENKIAGGQIINLGNPFELTISSLAELIIKLSSSKSEIVKLNKRLADDPEKRKPDISLARKLLNFNPKIGLNEGLKKTVDYFRKLNENQE